ncbi:MAG: hypothetical protein IT372_36095 [Polyangiaceae bacterium]|nr:hypothetical protein [Polyangiaceae bacterium]
MDKDKKPGLRDLEPVKAPTGPLPGALPGTGVPGIDGAGGSWRQTYTGGKGTPRDHSDLDCEE